MAFRNLAKELTATTGTADVVLSGAVDGFNTFPNAGVVDGEVVNYGIMTFDIDAHRPTDSEVGQGTWDLATLTLSRDNVIASTNGGAKISLTGLSWVFILALAQDIVSPTQGSFAIYNMSAYGNVPLSSSAQAPLNTQIIDSDGLFTLAGGILTATDAGWYDVNVFIGIGDPSNFINGNVKAYLVSDTVNTLPLAAFQGSVQTTPAHTDEFVSFAGPVNLDIGDSLAVDFDNNTTHNLNVRVMSVRILKLS